MFITNLNSLDSVNITSSKSNTFYLALLLAVNNVERATSLETPWWSVDQGVGSRWCRARGGPVLRRGRGSVPGGAGGAWVAVAFRRSYVY